MASDGTYFVGRGRGRGAALLSALATPVENRAENLSVSWNPTWLGSGVSAPSFSASQVPEQSLPQGERGASFERRQCDDDVSASSGEEESSGDEQLNELREYQKEWSRGMEAMAERGKELEMAMATLLAEKTKKKARRMKSSGFPKSEPVMSSTYAYPTPVQQHPNLGVTAIPCPQVLMPRHPQPFQHQQPLPASHHTHQQIPQHNVTHEQHHLSGPPYPKPVVAQGSMDSLGSAAAAAAGAGNGPPYGWRPSPLQASQSSASATTVADNVAQNVSLHELRSVMGRDLRFKSFGTGKDKLDYLQAEKQIRRAERKGYEANEIIDAVVEALPAGSEFRSVLLLKSNDLTVADLLDLLHSEYLEVENSDLLTQLTTAEQTAKEDEMAFLNRLIKLKERILYEGQLKISPETLMEMVSKSLEYGLQNEKIVTRLLPLFSQKNVSDAVLKQEMSKAMRSCTLRKDKVKKQVRVAAVE